MNTQKLLVARDRITARWANARAKVQDLLAEMSPRDRALLFGLVTFFALVIVIGSTVAMTAQLDGKAETLNNRQFQLQQVEAMREEFEEARSQLGDIEEKLASHGKTTLAAFLEKAAEKAQISDALKEVDQRGVSEYGGLEETQYAVRVSRVTLEQLVGFLYEVETVGFPVRITTMKVKTVYVSGEKLLDVNLDMAAVKIVDEETAG